MDEKYTTTTHYGKDCKVTVHRPVLDDEEHERRIEEIKQAAADVLRAIIREKRQKLINEYSNDSRRMIDPNL